MNDIKSNIDNSSIDSPSYIVLKIGTDALRYNDTNSIDEDVILHTARKSKELYDKGFMPVIVSSGAVMAGMNKEGVNSRPVDPLKLQYFSGRGIIELMSTYQHYLENEKLGIVPFLLTHDNLDSKDKRKEISNVCQECFNRGAVPLINEQDTLSSEELRMRFHGHEYYFDDNDGLSYLVSKQLNAKCCMMFNTGGGLYDDKKNLISKVVSEDKEWVSFMVEKRDFSTTGRGGVQSKVEYLFNCADNGIIGVMANSNLLTNDSISVFDILEKSRIYDRTLFLPGDDILW